MLKRGALAFVFVLSPLALAAPPAAAQEAADTEEMASNLAAADAAERVLPLEGSRNFRDLGGYATTDGRRVKWGMMYRSGVMAGLTDEAYDIIDGLNIRTVVDFRATEERDNEPTQWRGGEETTFLTWHYSTVDSSKALVSVFQKDDLSPQDVSGAMSALYGEMIYAHKAKFAALFEQLITTQEPLAFHCSAGKDRTGIAAALVLTALGVDRETVLADYAMTEKIVDYEAEFASGSDVDEASPYAFLAKLPIEFVRPLLRSDPAYLEAALARMQADYGSVMTYISEGLGVKETEIAAMRARLLD